MRMINDEYEIRLVWSRKEEKRLKLRLFSHIFRLYKHNDYGVLCLYNARLMAHSLSFTMSMIVWEEKKYALADVTISQTPDRSMLWTCLITLIELELADYDEGEGGWMEGWWSFQKKNSDRLLCFLHSLSLSLLLQE